MKAYCSALKCSKQLLFCFMWHPLYSPSLGSLWCRTGQIIPVLYPEIMPGLSTPREQGLLDGATPKNEYLVLIIGPSLPMENCPQVDLVSGKY